MMLRRASGVSLASVLFGALAMAGCQSPTSADDALDVDDFVVTSVSPARATAVPSSGRTYRVVRGNNQPDDVLEYDWITSFTLTVTLNSNATAKDIDLDFPVDISSVSGKVQQASGGIVTPPTGGEVEHYESVIAQSTGNRFDAVNSSVTLTFQVWYDLPSLRREALVSETLAFKDKNGKTFSKTVDVQVDP
jgi:hypothetical protein